MFLVGESGSGKSTILKVLAMMPPYLQATQSALLLKTRQYHGQGVGTRYERVFPQWRNEGFV